MGLARTLRRAPPLPRLAIPDHLGWHPQGDGRWWLGLHIPSGRVAGPLRAALREAVERFGVNPIATPGQDLLLSDVAKEDRAALEAMLRANEVRLPEAFSPIARQMMACVALPTCGQSLAEGERVRQPILEQVEAELDRLGLLEERISLRLTGCPNGCARPYQGDIGVVGRAPGLYTLLVGGDLAGTRLNFPLADKVPLEGIGATLAPLLAEWAGRREPAEGFGDFCARLGPEPCRAAVGVVLAA
ncbi:MAG: hypothetical protein WCP77_19055 [Roseococcus sp.]